MCASEKYILGYRKLAMDEKKSAIMLTLETWYDFNILNDIKKK